MANILNQKGVLILDTVADNIIPAGSPVHVVSCKLIVLGVAGQFTISDAGNAQPKIELGAAINGHDESQYVVPLVLNGLRVIGISATGARLYVYTT